MENNVISINNLCGGYDNLTILKDIVLNISKGGFTAIAGPNGSGKSTLLKYLFKELQPQKKTIFLNGKDIESLKQKEVAKLISFQGQFSRSFGDFTVRQLIEMGRFAYNEIPAKKLIDKAIEKVKIEHLAEKQVSKISGGEFQLTMLARTICQDAEILALDEPINNLDPHHQIMLLDLLKDLSKNHKTVLCVLHDLNAILRSCEKTILMKEGQIFAYGKTDEILTESNIRAVYNIDVELVQVNKRKIVIM